MISVVCPVYNEAENIEPLLTELQQKVSIPLELLVVYDRDEDTTLPVLNRISPNFSFPITLVKNKFGRGVLNAIRSGFLEAKHDAVLVMMADLSDDLAKVDEMYRLMNQGGYDVVCASRYMRGGRQLGGPVLKGLLSRCAGVSLHYLAGIPTRDVTNNFKMYRRQLLESIRIESSGGFEVAMEIVVKAFASGRKITELPATWSDRVAGESKFRMWNWIPKYLRWYLYALRHSPKNRLSGSQIDTAR